MDKRKDPRRKIMAFTPVYALEPKTLLGYLDNLTLRGARVVGDVFMEEGALVNLSIHFSQGASDVPTPPLLIRGRVVRDHTDEAQYENLGFEFVDATAEQIAALEAVIQRFEF